MIDSWHAMTLGDFVSLQRGHDLPEQQRRPGKVPILGSFGVTGYHDMPKAKGPGITVGRSGASFGVVSYSPVDFWPLNTALYVTDFHGNDERFAYYFLKTIDFKRYNSGSAQPSLNRNYVHLNAAYGRNQKAEKSYTCTTPPRIRYYPKNTECLSTLLNKMRARRAEVTP
jgi:type I restriction enzyme S subunit